MCCTISVAYSLNGILNTRYFRTAPEHSLSDIECKAQKMLGEIFFVLLCFFQITSVLQKIWQELFLLLPSILTHKNKKCNNL